MVPQVPSCYFMLLMQPSRFKFNKITPLLWWPLNYFTFQIITPTHIGHKTKILLLLSHAPSTYHPNVFTPILSLSEGPLGTAYNPSSNKILFLPPEIKYLSLLPVTFHSAPTLLLPFLPVSFSFLLHFNRMSKPM
jgi:hypothetical protein